MLFSIKFSISNESFSWIYNHSYLNNTKPNTKGSLSVSLCGRISLTLDKLLAAMETDGIFSLALEYRIFFQFILFLFFLRSCDAYNQTHVSQLGRKHFSDDTSYSSYADFSKFCFNVSTTSARLGISSSLQMGTLDRWTLSITYMSAVPVVFGWICKDQLIKYEDGRND